MRAWGWVTSVLVSAFALAPLLWLARAAHAYAGFGGESQTVDGAFTMRQFIGGGVVGAAVIVAVVTRIAARRARE